MQMIKTKATAHGVKRVYEVAAAAGVALSVGFGAMPAWAVEQPTDGPSALSSPSVASPVESLRWTEGLTADGSGVSEAHTRDAGLREAALRDLGLTPEEFAAAGQLGKQAADVVAALQGIPGYRGTRLHDGSILVAGTGEELAAEVDRLSASFPAVALEASPPAAPSSAPTEGSGAQAATGAEPGTGTEWAQSTQQLYQAYLREVGAAGLQAVAFTGSAFVIRTGGVNGTEATVPDSADTGGESPSRAAPILTSPSSDGRISDGKVSPAEFVARYANVELDAGSRLAPQADLPGGLGYAADNGYVCSTGFSAFDPAGLPAVLSAGHCTSDGAAESAMLQFQGVPAGLLGKFGFSQFGGPGNTTVLDPPDRANPGNVGTDIAVIEELRADLDPLPAASTWGHPSEPGPDVKVIGAAAPVVGMPVCRSGRTSAWSCGTIDEVGIYVVQGVTAAPTDLRAFNGFL